MTVEELSELLALVKDKSKRIFVGNNKKAEDWVNESPFDVCITTPFIVDVHFAATGIKPQEDSDWLTENKKSLRGERN